MTTFFQSLGIGLNSIFSLIFEIQMLPYKHTKFIAAHLEVLVLSFIDSAILSRISTVSPISFMIG
jgi:hypothetical protein